MKHQNVPERVVAVVADQFNRAVETITPESNFVDDLAGDSLDQVELIMQIEDEFEIEITDESADKIRTVQQAIDYIAAL